MNDSFGTVFSPLRDKYRALDKMGIDDSSKIIFLYFSMKTYFVTPYYNRLDEAFLMMGHNIRFKRVP